jgi:hypothetical protein
MKVVNKQPLEKRRTKWRDQLREDTCRTEERKSGHKYNTLFMAGEGKKWRRLVTR